MEGVRRRERRKRLFFPKNFRKKSADCDQVSLFFQPWRDELKKKSATKAVGRVDLFGGPNPRFVCCRESSRRGVRVRNRVERARARVPSTVATSSTAHDTRVVSTTRAHTSSPVETHRKRSGGFFVRGEGTFETRVWDSVCVFSCSGDESEKRRRAGVARAVCAPPQTAL